MAQLPRRFALTGHVIQIKRVKELASNCSCDGRYWQSRNLIEIQCPDEGKWAASYTDHVLWHEIMHAVFSAAGRDDLSADESLVDAVGGLVAQVVRTLK